jgi:tetratricopeptide (TPR) repeat protein
VALAQKALALDPTTTSAYRLLAFINMYNRRYDLALGQIGHALEINPSDVDGYHTRGKILVFAGRAREAVPWLRFDRGHLLTANSLCWAYYFLCRYNEAVETADRALSRGPGSSVQMITLRFLRPRTARWDDQDAEGERDHHVSVPLFEARTFAGQFGTQEAGDHLLEGPKKPGFIEHRRVRARSPKLAESRLKPVTNTTIN